MDKQEMLRLSGELRSTMEKASRIVDRLRDNLPSQPTHPSLDAQCNVMRTFLWQVERQEHLITDMIQKKIKG